MKATQQHTSVLNYDNLLGIYHVMREHGDQVNADKIVDLYKKKQKNEFIISFAGHFSAGKSSMINALIGTELLPKSPIPTSANIVKLSSGSGVARVFFHQEAPIEYEEPYDLDMIKEYCKDKDSIERIEISSSQPIIPENCSIIDTPGIDAADDTDRIITESSLHLVDVLFYVMDYNHVQSEVNLMFLKTIQAMNIPFYIIINQIDKHNEQELTFASFENSVKQTFDQWGLSPQEVYFSSLFKKEMAINQFDQIKAKVNELFLEESVQRIDSSVRTIIEAHKQFLKEKLEESVAELSSKGGTDKDFIYQVENLQSSIETIKQKPINLEKDFIEALDQTLKNAYLMPATVRDKALHFLESQQKDFKVGFLGAKKKTEEERERRLTEFLTAVTESMKASIEWKLREKFTALLKTYAVVNQDLNTDLQQLTVNISPDDLYAHVKKGATVNGDYVLNYANDLGHSIKTKYRNASRKLLRRIITVMENDGHQTIAQYEEQLREHKELMKVHEELASWKEAYHKQLTRIENQLHSPEYSNETESMLNKQLESTVFLKGETVSALASHTEPQREEVRPSVITDEDDVPHVQKVIQAIDKTAQLVEELPGFESITRELKIRKERLENRDMTIALFGAFSAGKSSFANALIGEGVLPSSPNPTTAVINRITPVTDEYQHGSVVIQLKSEHTLSMDLANILKHFSPPTTADICTYVGWIKQHQIQYHEDLSQMYQSYLQAFIKGYDAHKDIIGKTITIQLDEFAAYATDESKACFVETIDLYYDCSITQKGITLVDTPGADSVNARHTNVAFDYIKTADAILYVTYYNHAITKADKDFVMQLGRVKESFQLDKMFFIINAADLASDQTELQLVTNYVKEQLTKLGIRNPRLYPVSSKKSLEEKLVKAPINRQLRMFEEDFYHFLENELSHLAIKSSIHELHRTRQLLHHFKQKANLNKQEKEKYKQELLDKQEMLSKEVLTVDGMVYQERINQKIAKQLHYVMERIGIRFHDMFKDKFNPTTVTESGRKAVHQLQKNTIDLLDYAGYETLQEARAVSLRMEAFMKEQQIDLIDNFKHTLTKLDENFGLPAFDTVNLDTPEFTQPLQDMNLSAFQKSYALFKSTKSFFEKNEKEKMKESIYEILQPEIQSYLMQTEEIMKEAYGKQWQTIVTTITEEINSEINQYVQSSMAILDDVIDINLLTSKEEHLAVLLESIN
ncbi:dynamin family protein [Ornithinibacillus sp. FSL M8-0202]|uniref:dynamin family protein n=1 Tax=Ornithinibacillus sp. FSL M8-0202 TaxID=2921616 RepID=UPI0030CC5310